MNWIKLSVAAIRIVYIVHVKVLFKDNPSVFLLSHTVDPERDSVVALREFAGNLGVEAAKWHMVTGDKEMLYQLAVKKYLLPAREDANAPGGFLHSDKFMLVDGNGRIRGAYSGTDKADVDKLMEDVEILLLEK